MQQLKDLTGTCYLCKFCKYKTSELSGSGYMSRFDYECKNENSDRFNEVMSKVTSPMGIIDSRKDQGCDKFEKNSTFA